MSSATALTTEDTVTISSPRRGAARPRARLIHHMARSGGTIVSKCLGCMSGVLLLSEIHPMGTAQFNPLIQAQRWYGLLAGSDLIELKNKGRVGFADAIGLIHQRADECGQRMVIRDWSHLDFTGVPFVPQPAYRLLTAEALAPRFELRQICTVRHPLDQWLSLSQLVVVRGKLSLAGFLEGYRRFAETAVDIGFERYEDFTANPAKVMKAICGRLDLRFDRKFIEHWQDYTFVTGDVAGSRGGARIGPVPRRPVPPDLIAAMAGNPDYRASLDLLGYQHPE